MSERLCGYCRAPGHRKPDCPTFINERNLVLTHAPKERKRLIEAFGEVGLGIGAMISYNAPSWATDQHFIGLVKDFSWVGTCSFMNSKQLKYSKRVKLEPLYVEQHYEHRNIHMNVVAMGNGVAEERRIAVPITRLLKRKKFADYVKREEVYFNPLPFTIVEPSHDIEIDREALIYSVTMPRRLLLTGESDFQKGILPPDLA
jgi:hypothetical protein